jgi:hypothetical protein
LSIPSVPPNEISVNRRQAIAMAGAACLSGWTIAGCRENPSPVSSVSPDARTDIPIRVVLVGGEDVAETISRGWSSVSEQAIDVRTIAMDRAAPTRAINDLVTAAAKSDVLIGPASAIAELFAEKSIVPLTGDELSSIGEDLYPALRNGLARYASELVAVPVATPLPAIWMSADDADATINTWADYDRLVDTVWKGNAAEPTAQGWAAMSFLWRASTSVSRWLFSRENLAPVIVDDDYADCLTQMATTVARYRQPRQTAADVYQAIREGNINGGLAFPTDASPIDGDWNVTALPAGKALVDSLVKPLPDVFSVVGMLSSNCRQTAASKTFLDWLSGGEGSQATRRKLPPMQATRESIVDGVAGPYASWVKTPLRSAVALPVLQVIAAGDYYRVLDEAVTRCLDGKATAKESLAAAAKQWNEITTRVGDEKQLRAWRRAQGMRA